MTEHALLHQLERYLDAVPRHAARAESHGPLTLFVKAGTGWPYYARPTIGAGDVTLAQLTAVQQRQRELALPQSVEWLEEITPSLRAIAEQADMAVQALPLMVLREPLQTAEPIGARVLVLPPDDPRLAQATAVARVGFAHPTTTNTDVGVGERDASAAEMTVDHLEFTRDRMRRGLTVTAAAIDNRLGPLSVGSHQPIDSVTEIVGVATLPSARRRGLAAAVTARLVGDAEGRGVRTVFLSAGSPEVARLYARLGFERIGTSCIADARGT